VDGDNRPDHSAKLESKPHGWLFAESHPPMRTEEARVEAEACLQCGGPEAPAPCIAACPTGIDVPGFIREIAAGRPLDAARIIFGSNILGGTCARVCPVEELCQGSCVLQRRGRRAIQIGRLQRFATDALEAEECCADLPERQRRQEPSVGVIGAGPAGLACAHELAQLGYSVTVYERRPLPGGTVVYGIAPYKQVIDPIPAEVERIRRLGVEFRFEVEVGRDITAAQLRERHLAVFLGVGMGPDTRARLPGEDLPGVWESLEFIERIKLGRARPVSIGRRVLVIGGGNTAIDVAREAVRLGANEVTVMYRRDEAQMPAYRHEIRAAKNEGVRLLCLAAPLAFIGAAEDEDAGGRVQAARCIRMEPGEPDDSGRPRPVPIPQSEFSVQADTVIMAIGQQPHAELFTRLGLEAPAGVVKADRDHRTNQRWCYAGGDCTSGGATVVEAVRDGRAAALAIHRALADVPPPPPRIPLEPQVIERGRVISHMQGAFELATAPTLCKGCNICVESCPSSVLYLDSQNRISVTNVNGCVFCGICEDRCPDFAIWIHKDAALDGTVPSAMESPAPCGDEVRR
jgi:dihydropyrimidine dehydrogenase (NAD+) subunit PreT